MEQKLIQKKGFTTSSYELKKDGLFITRNSPSNSIEEEISYEEITNKVVRETSRQTFYIFITILFAIGSLLPLFDGSIVGFIVFLIISIVFIILFRTSIKKTVHLYLNSNKVITIFANVPDTKTVDDFLDLLNKTVKAYLIKKFVPLDKDLPIEPQLNSLKWLWDNNYIDEQQFKDYKAELLNKKDKTEIGF